MINNLEIYNEILKYKNRINVLINEKKDILDPEILETSQCLDVLLNQYQGFAPKESP